MPAGALRMQVWEVTMPFKPPTHRPKGQRTPEQNRAHYEQSRPQARARGYDGDWSKLRKTFLSQHPLCCIEGCGERATVVDHIQSIRARPDLRLDPTNLRSMCRSHHSARTMKDQSWGSR